MTRPTVIDVHAHVVPLSCLGLVGGKAESQNFVGDMTDLDRRLADMDAGGVDIQVMSAWQGFFNQTLAVAGQFNDAIAAYAAQAPTRLAAMAVAPLAEPNTAARELERSVGVLGLKGVAIGSNAGGRPIDDPAFEPFFEAAEALAVPIFIHPTNPLGADRLRDLELINLLGFVTDTALAAARLALGGLMARRPGLRIHLAHGGGSTAMLAGRWDHGWHERPAAHGAPEAPSTYLRRMYVDSILHDRRAMDLALAFWGKRQIMLGTDYPYDMGMPRAAEWILCHPGLSRDDKAAILGGNAAGFFGLDGQPGSAAA